MALITCPKCGAQAQDSQGVCPRCALPFAAANPPHNEKNKELSDKLIDCHKVWNSSSGFLLNTLPTIIEIVLWILAAVFFIIRFIVFIPSQGILDNLIISLAYLSLTEVIVTKIFDYFPDFSIGSFLKYARSKAIDLRESRKAYVDSNKIKPNDGKITNSLYYVSYSAIKAESTPKAYARLNILRTVYSVIGILKALMLTIAIVNIVKKYSLALFFVTLQAGEGLAGEYLKTCFTDSDVYVYLIAWACLFVASMILKSKTKTARSFFKP